LGIDSEFIGLLLIHIPAAMFGCDESFFDVDIVAGVSSEIVKSRCGDYVELRGT
jgi:hypothetical protein